MVAPISTRTFDKIIQLDGHDIGLIEGRQSDVWFSTSLSTS